MSTELIDTRNVAAPAVEEPLTAFCPTYARATDLLARRWMGVILRVLLGGPRRFNEILAAIPSARGSGHSLPHLRLGPVTPRMTFEGVFPKRCEFFDELLANCVRERRGDAADLRLRPR